MTFPEVERRLNRALRQLCYADAYLIEVGANERSITHHLAIYLQAEFTGWRVDVEYNRDLGDTKTLPTPWRRAPESLPQPTAKDTDAVTVFPDIIVHQRGTDQENLLVIEVKKLSRGDHSFDHQKFEGFTSQPLGGLGYRWGIHIVLPAGPESMPSKTWFEMGAALHDLPARHSGLQT